MNPLYMRIGVALLTVQKLREAIEANNGMYHGGLIPNLQSITDLLTLPPDIFNQQMTLPGLEDYTPTPEMLRELQNTIGVQ